MKSTVASLSAAGQRREAILVGAVAGALPMLINLVNVEASTLFATFDPAFIAGYVVRALGLMLLGAFFVYVNRETDLKKALQLGIMAPAVIVGLINGNAVSQDRTAEETANVSHHSSDHRLASESPAWRVSFSLFPSAHAQNTAAAGAIKPTTTERFWRGLTGQISGVWSVMAGQYKTRAEAAVRVARLQRQGVGAEIAKSSAGFQVILGARLERDVAQQLLREAEQKVGGKLQLQSRQP